jgi:hypothetical protein
VAKPLRNRKDYSLRRSSLLAWTSDDFGSEKAAVTGGTDAQQPAQITDRCYRCILNRRCHHRIADRRERALGRRLAWWWLARRMAWRRLAWWLLARQSMGGGVGLGLVTGLALAAPYYGYGYYDDPYYSDYAPYYASGYPYGYRRAYYGYGYHPYRRVAHYRYYHGYHRHHYRWH